MKKCKGCKKVKHETQYSRHRTNKDRLQTYCRKCCSAQAKESHLLHPHKRRNNKLRHRYGITVEVFDDMLRKQKGVCAICLQPPRNGRQLCVDHCHMTKKVRGLLCPACNRGIGFFKDSIEHLNAAKKYLKRNVR